MMATPAQIIAKRREYECVGVEEVYLSMRDAYALEPVSLFGATVIPAFG
jgi:hypothetical protein